MSVAGREIEVSALMLTYRSAGYVSAALRCLDTALRGLAAEIVVVDNDSGDGVEQVVSAFAASAHVPVRLVVRDTNDGFAAGCTAGADVAVGRLLLMVNPDVTVGPNAVRELVAAARSHPQAGIIGGRALDVDGRQAALSWWGRPTLWSTFCFATGLSSLAPGHPVLDPEAPDRWDGREREVDVVSGGFMLIDRRVWDALGGFDRRFLLYGEDVDLCLRARRSGWRPRVTPGATFRHDIGGSSAPAARTGLVLKGRATVLRRHLPMGTRTLGIGLLVVGCGLRAAGADLVGRRGVGPGRVSSHGAGRQRTGSVQWQAAWRSRRSWARGWTVGDTLGESS